MPLHTPICDLFGIQVPIIQAGMAGYTSPELVAAVCNAGGLGSLGAGLWTPAELRDAIRRTRELTDRPFAINYSLPRGVDEESFAITLEEKPRVVSFTLGEPRDLVQRAHDADILVMHQVGTVEQARRAVEEGVDVIIAQGSEAGGFSGTVTTLVLVPQIVDAVGAVPVVAAGGIADGRQLAAAIALGAQGTNIGTRFLASQEAPIREEWEQGIVSGSSEDTVKVDFWATLFPSDERAYPTTPRVLPSDYINEWRDRSEEVRQQADRLREQMVAAMQENRWDILLPFAGQSVGLIHEILPAAEIVRRIVAEAEEALQRVARLVQVRRMAEGVYEGGQLGQTGG